MSRSRTEAARSGSQGGPVWVLGLSLLAAVLFRCLVGADPTRLKLWLVPAAAFFLLATIAWASLVGPAVRAAGKDAGK